jgi:5-methylcytosine-specific restriction endonuclease McrA
MPTKPSARCTQPGCSNKATYRGRCEQHQDNWQHASKHTLTINRALWERVRRQALRRDHNTCVECGKPGNEVDHIREVADNGALYDLANLQTLCHQCHLRKSIMMAQRRRRNKQSESDDHDITMSVWQRYVQGRQQPDASA